jgi:hypothetical protein
MPVCVAVQSGNVLVLDPTHTDLSTCAYVIEDGSSNAWRELGNMSIEQAGQIGTAVGLVWAIAWGFKQLVRAVRVDEVSPG